MARMGVAEKTLVAAVAAWPVRRPFVAGLETGVRSRPTLLRQLFLSTWVAGPVVSLLQIQFLTPAMNKVRQSHSAAQRNGCPRLRCPSLELLSLVCSSLSSYLSGQLVGRGLGSFGLHNRLLLLDGLRLTVLQVLSRVADQRVVTFTSLDLRITAPGEPMPKVAKHLRPPQLLFALVTTLQLHSSPLLLLQLLDILS